MEFYDISRTKLRVDNLKKKTLILRKSDLNRLGAGKDINDLTFADFRVYFLAFQFANKVLYMHKGRIKVLKERNPTEWSIIKKQRHV